MRRWEPVMLLAPGTLLLVLSEVGAYDRTTWELEVFPIVLAVPVLVATARRFPLTPLAYRLIFLHAVILMVGGHYTYARVPLGFWCRMRCTWRATTTTGWATSRRDSCRRSWCARSCCAARPSCAASGFSSWWPRSA